MQQVSKCVQSKSIKYSWGRKASDDTFNCAQLLHGSDTLHARQHFDNTFKSSQSPPAIQSTLPSFWKALRVYRFFRIYHIKQNHFFIYFLILEQIVFTISRDESLRLIPSRQIPGSHQSRDENIRLIPPRKISGSLDFAKSHSVPSWIEFPGNAGAWLGSTILLTVGRGVKKIDVSLKN